jgi:hypothetical protein
VQRIVVGAEGLRTVHAGLAGAVRDVDEDEEGDGFGG